MKTVNGKYTSAKVFTNNVEDYALAQIQKLCDNEVFKDCKVRIMPDVHPGKVGTIGFTSSIGDKIMPMVLGNDIGCGISIDKIKNTHIEFQKLDTVIREHIPSGFNIRNNPHDNANDCNLFEFNCIGAINKDKYEKSIGTLGGGNHFIEIDVDKKGDLYLTVHSGSRYTGQCITDYYLKEGQFYLRKRGIEVPYELTWLEGRLMKQYIHDVSLATYYAQINRLTILRVIEKYMKLKPIWYANSNHNCIYNDPFIIPDRKLILRKGAVSAYEGETVIIPVNMKEGIILGEGKGNPDWNYSAPHGSGRIMNRENVKSNFTVSQFKSEMKGIYCSCIGKDTLDEAPFAYRGLEEIKEAISETVEVKTILTPVYNFKAGSKEK